MMFKTIAASISLFSLVSLPAAAEPTKMTSDVLDQVVAGTDYCPPPVTGKMKGNNGWGNGEDPTNPGSGKGATAPSKLAGVNMTPPPNKINTNPTGTSGR